MKVSSSLPSRLSQRSIQSAGKQVPNRLAGLQQDVVHFSGGQRPIHFASDEEVTFSDLQAAEKKLLSRLKPKSGYDSLFEMQGVDGVGAKDTNEGRALTINFSTKEDRDKMVRKILNQPGAMPQNRHGDAGPRIISLPFTRVGESKVRRIPIIADYGPVM